MLRSRSLLLPLLYTLQSYAFDFEFPEDPRTCREYAVSWSGGNPPFFLNLIPVFGTPRNIPIPATAFENGQGSYTLPELPFSPDTQFMVAMSDSGGFGTNASPVFSPRRSRQSCNTDDPGVDFSFQLNSDLQQCRDYVISSFDRAAPPAQIIIIVPDGPITVLNPPSDTDSLSWQANVREGSSLLVMMTDSEGRQGGTSRIMTVGGSGDDTCLASNSPTTTDRPTASPTSSSGRTTTSSTAPTSSSVAADSPNDNDDDSNSTPVGAIAGGILGALAIIGVIFALFFFWRRRQRTQKQWSRATPLSDSPFPFFPGYQGPTQPTPPSDPFHDENSIKPFSEPLSQSYGYNAGISNYPPQPLPTTPSTAPYGNQPPLISPFNSPIRRPSQGSSSPDASLPAATSLPVEQPAYMRTQRIPVPADPPAPVPSLVAQQKALEAMPNNSKPRFILHTDAEDTRNDLPPEYSERRMSRFSDTASRSSLAYAQDTFVEDLPPRR